MILKTFKNNATFLLVLLIFLGLIDCLKPMPSLNSNRDNIIDCIKQFNCQIKDDIKLKTKNQKFKQRTPPLKNKSKIIKPI